MRNVRLARHRGWQDRGMALDSLPILDISELDRGDTAAAGFREKLRRVTHEVGFFYLVGHGIPQDLIDEVLDLARRFFALPEGDKLSIENVRSPQFRGYTRTGQELTNGAVVENGRVTYPGEKTLFT